MNRLLPRRPGRPAGFTHHDDTWTVGYDRPLHTFYAQVEPSDKLTNDPHRRAAFLQRHPSAGAYDLDELLFTVTGEQQRELPTVTDLTTALTARGVDVPNGVRTMLERDQLQAVAAAPLTTVTRHLAVQAAHHALTTAGRPAGEASSAPPPRQR